MLNYEHSVGRIPPSSHIGQRFGHLVCVDGGSEHRQLVRQLRDLIAVEERRSRGCVCEAEDQRGVEPLVGGVVVRDVGRVPELLVPGHEHLGSQLGQHAGVRESGHELVGDVLPERSGADAFSSPEVDQGSSPRFLAGPGDVVPAGRVRRPGVEQGAPEHVHLVLVREPGLLPAPQRRERGGERDLGDPVDPAICGNGRLDAVGGGPQPGIGCGEVELPVLVEPRRCRDDLRVGALPVVHSLLARLIGAHPQQDR